MKSRFTFFAICIFFLTTSMSFGYTATFLPRVSVDGEYTDNIFLTDNESNIDEDFITTITPGFSAEILGKNNGVNMSYNAAYAMYKNYNDFDGWRHNADLKGWSQMTKRTRLAIRDSFLYTEDPIKDENLAVARTEDPGNPVDFSVRKSRQIYYTNFANINLNHQFGKNNSFNIAYSYYLRNDEDPLFEDNQYHNPSAALRYWFGPQWGFEVGGEYQLNQYEFSEDIEVFVGNVGFLRRFGKNFIGYIRYRQLVVSYETGENDDQTYNPSIGFDYDIAKDISVKLDMGYFRNDFESREDTDAFNGSLRLIKEFEHGKINLSASGGFDYDLYSAEKLGFSKFYEGAVSGNYQLAKFINGRIRGSYRDTEYIDQSDRKDKIGTVGAGLTWQALKWMNVRLDYRFRSLDSTIKTENYDENRVMVSIGLVPNVPFHTSRY
jgi:Putative beta-barrel porin 2